MIEIVKKLVTDCEEYIVSVHYSNTIVYNINNNEIILSLGETCNPKYIRVSINETVYFVYFNNIENPIKYCDFVINNRIDEAIILDGIENSINNFRKYQLNKISSNIELIEPELL